MVTQHMLDFLGTFNFGSMVRSEADDSVSFTDPRTYRDRDGTPISKREVDVLARVTRADLDQAITRLAELQLGLSEPVLPS